METLIDSVSGQDLKLTTMRLPVVSNQSVRISVGRVKVTEARLFSGNVLLSLMTPQLSESGAFDCDFFNGDVFHAGLAPAVAVEVTYYDDQTLPELQIAEETTPHLTLPHSQLVCVHTPDGPKKLSLCYGGSYVGYQS